MPSGNQAAKAHSETGMYVTDLGNVLSHSNLVRTSCVLEPVVCKLTTTDC